MTIKDRVDRLFIPEPMSGCWLWTGKLSTYGYGIYSVRQGDGTLKQRQAHRVVYEQYVGMVAADLDLDHVCRTRLCVNPDHLEPVSHKENMRRSPLTGQHHKRRLFCYAGHPYEDGSYLETKTDTGTRRQCKACNTIKNRRWQAEKRKRMRGTS